MSDNEKRKMQNGAVNETDSSTESAADCDKSMKDELAELIKPIAIHEAKSAIYKAKLAGYVLKKGAQGANKAAKLIQEKTGSYMKNHKKNKRHKK